MKESTPHSIPKNKGVAQKQNSNFFAFGNGAQHITSFIQPKLAINTPGDPLEVQADVVARQVVNGQRPSMLPTIAKPAAFTPVQRDEDGPREEQQDPLTGGLSVLGSNLMENNPKFTGLLNRLKLRLWDNQPSELKAGIIGFGITDALILGTVFALDPTFRGRAINALDGVNLMTPLHLIPNAEFFTPSSLTYHLPAPGHPSYEFNGEFDLAPYFKFLHEQHPSFPIISPRFGLNLNYNPANQSLQVVGGTFGLDLFNRAIKIEGGVNQFFNPAPSVFMPNDPFAMPVTSMLTLPSQPIRDTRFSITIDVPRLINVIRGVPETAIRRKEDKKKEDPLILRKQAHQPVAENGTADTGKSTIVSRKETNIGAKDGSLDIVQQALQTGGNQLDDEIRQYMEDRFGVDFSQVKIHDDSLAHQSSSAINALAYTHQNHIVFGAGQYNTQTNEGKTLLAHELTHVVQQGAIGATNNVDRFFDTLTPVAITATGFRPAALVLSEDLVDETVKNNARIMVAIGNRMHIYDGNGVQLTTSRAVRLTGPIPMGNGVYKSMSTGDGNVFFFRLFTNPDGSVALMKGVHNRDEEGGEDLMLNNSVREADQPYLNDTLGEVPHWFLIMPGGAGGSGGTASTPSWATRQVTRVTRRLAGRGTGSGRGEGAGEGETEPEVNPVPPNERPERVVPFSGERGVHANVWAGGAHTTITLNQGETDEALEARIRAATAALLESRDPTMSVAVAEGASETGFIDATAESRPQSEMPGSGVVMDPEQERLRLTTAEGRANWPPYPARINNYGTDISVTGGNNRMAMEIDYAIAGADTLSQVVARLQHINYLWEIFDVTNVAVETDRDAMARRGAGGGEYVGAGSGAGNELYRDMANIYEDQVADLQLMNNAGAAGIANWEVRKAQLALMAVSSVVRSIGSLISSFVSIVTTPINERNIGWDREGEFVVRCVATPSHDEESPNRRASSVAVQVIKIQNIHTRAEEAVMQPDRELELLRERLARAIPGEQRDAIMEAITRAERIRGQSTMENVAEQLQAARQRLADATEVVNQRRDGTDPTSMSVGARLLRVQLAINGIEPEAFKDHVAEQVTQMINMQRYGRQMANGMRPPLFRPRVVLASEENGQVFQMVTMLAETTASNDRRRIYRLVDMTSPNTQDSYDGESTRPGIEGHSEAVSNAFIRYRENNGYGRGTIAIWLPPEMPAGLVVPQQMRSAPGERGRWIRRLQDLATVAEIAGLVLTGPAGMAVGILGGIAGAAVAVDSLMRRSHAGRFSWNFQTIMDVTGVIGGAIPFLGIARRFERTVYFIGIAQLGQSALAIPIQLEEQLRAIEMQIDLPEGERRARRAEAFLQAVRSGAVLVVTARQMAAQGVPAVHESPTSTTRGSGDASVDSSTSPVRDAVEPADSTRATDPDIARPPAETTPGNVEPADSTRATDPDIVRPPAETTPGDTEPADSTRPTLPDIDVPRESRTDTEGNTDGEPLSLEPGIEDGIRRERGDTPTRPTTDEPVPGSEPEADSPETRREDPEAEGPTRTTIAPRATEPIIAASQRLRARIAELLGATTLSEHGSEPVRTRQRALQVEGLLRNNPDLTILAHDTIIEIGNFKTIRERMRTSFFGDTPEAILMAQQVLQEVRMQLGDSAIREGLEFANQLYPGLTPRTVDQGTPGFASDRDVTLQFRGGGESNVNQRIDASMQAVTRAYESLRRRGIEPDTVLDTNFYTELHEAAIRPETRVEAAQILFDQSVVSMAEMRMNMSGADWTAYREAQMQRLTGTAELQSLQGRMEADARRRLGAEMDAAETLAGRLRPDGATRATQDVRLAAAREALSAALQRNAPPRELRQLMAEIKLLEPEAYGTRAAVESVVGRQQAIARGDAGTYMSGRSLPEGRVERLAFLAQDASSNLGMLFGHSPSGGTGSTAATARSVAKYLQRVAHAVVVDGRLSPGASREFIANLQRIIQTKNITSGPAADAATISLVREGLIAGGHSREAVTQMSDDAALAAWVTDARAHGMDLLGHLRTAEQMAHSEPGTIDPLVPPRATPPSEGPASEGESGEATLASTDAALPVVPTAENLPIVPRDTLPLSWTATPVPPSGGSNVTVYRGFARNAETHMATVVREGEIGGILTRALDTASDAVFNQVERNPVLEGPNMAGVVAITIPAQVWDALVASNSISERGNYPGFSRQLNSTEIRVNSVEAGRLINSLEKTMLPPDPNFDFRTPF